MYFDCINSSMHTRPGDLDINGHVNNAKVLELFEAGRWFWLQEMGLENRGGIFSVVLSIRVRYLREIGHQKLACSTRLVLPKGVNESDWLDELTYKSNIIQLLYDSNGEIELAKAEVEIAFINEVSRNPVSLQDFLYSQ